MRNHSKDSLLNNIEIDLTGMIYSGHKLNARHITSVLDKYRSDDYIMEEDEWDWEDEEPPYNNDDDDDD
jgi:hypothetical protein